MGVGSHATAASFFPTEIGTGIGSRNERGSAASASTESGYGTRMDTARRGGGSRSR